MKSPEINNSKGGHVIVEKVRYMISDAAALAGVENPMCYVTGKRTRPDHPTK